ncbi:hypothetical protein MHU86_23343 [Fragilaria crotonensis]|nr:hypothetical protein MHU86_23343 [Fragilaria crotonensis]
MKPNRRGDYGVLAGTGSIITSPCTTSVANLGRTARVSESFIVDKEEDAKKQLPSNRDERNSYPTHRRLVALLSMAVIPEERASFCERFWEAKGEYQMGGRRRTAAKLWRGHRTVPNLCNTPISWIAKAFECEPFRLRSACDMFPCAGTESAYMNEFYVMDVILNRSCLPPASEVKKDGGPTPIDPDVVRPFRCYEPDDLNPEKDYLFRSAILFLPQCGVFYCHRERRRGDVGVPGTFIAHDMSWLRLQRNIERRVDGVVEVSYDFGSDSFVKCFFAERKGPRFHVEDHYISAWRISTGKLSRTNLQNRVMYRAIQCRDTDGPMLAPDILDGVEFPGCPRDYLAADYTRRLAVANSARKDGRHYVPGCLHYQLPLSCWIIDPTVTHCVDIMVDVDRVGGTLNRQSVVMIRNVREIEADDDLIGSLRSVTAHNVVLRTHARKGTARARGGDVGTMHAIGTHVELDRTTTNPYMANGRVPEGLLRQLVVNLAIIGSNCFPQVYAVLRDTEGDSGLLPIEPMNGETEVNPVGLPGVDRKMNGEKEKKVGRRVGYTIDMSVDLANSSHLDVHDASQGFSVWSEEFPGRATNWFFVLPNLHGQRPDRTTFRGVAVKLSHGIAISWDGRVVRHCTSVSHPDGVDGGRLGGVGAAQLENHLYGTFTAAKERIVQAGRAVSAANYVPSDVLPSDDDSDAGQKVKRKRCRKKRRRGKRVHTGVVCGDATASDDTGAGGDPLGIDCEESILSRVMPVAAANDHTPGVTGVPATLRMDSLNP